MTPGIATAIFLLGILGLFLLDRDRDSRTSPALWIAVAWVLIAASRTVSQWLNPGETYSSADDLLEGSPLDRVVLTGLLAAGLAVLCKRGERTGGILQLNGPILLFLLYGAVSCLWSDYPDVAFKRWIKAFGNFVMVLVVLTDPDPPAAVKRLFARTGFLLIPLSLLVIKYYPDIGRYYAPHEGTQGFSGVTTHKNGLGYVCLVFGLGSVWRFLNVYRGRDGARRAGPLIAHGTILAMAIWLIWLADSATSQACLLIGGGLIGITSLPVLVRKPSTVHLLIGGLVFLGLFGLLLDAITDAAGAMGRDPTLTGRTQLWEEVLSTNTDPWFGTGFESFWLGERAKWFWKKYWWRPNQAHNGYIELFINLGWVGLALHGFVMAWGYRNVVAAFRQYPGTGRLRLAYFVVAVVYNVTEAAFTGMHPVWIAFLLAVTAMPKPPRREER